MSQETDVYEGKTVLRWRFLHGQGMVEFALILPLLLLVIFLLIEGALLLQAYLAVQHAAREAARWAITYQPPQGCKLEGNPYHKDHCDPSDPCTNPGANPPFVSPPYDYRQPGNNCDPQEDVNEYNARRVAMIKMIALERAVGLRINQSALGLTESNFQAYSTTPGFFGVRVWGFPAFDAPEQVDHPSLPGLPVRVHVVHNVELIDPLFRAMVRYIPVESHVTMLNEGVQVGFGNLPPPTFQPPPTLIVPTIPPSTPEPTTPTPTPRPIRYRVDILFDALTNRLPDERGHNVPVQVTDEDTGQVLPNVRVSFSTSFGSFDFSGTGPGYGEAMTDDTGTAVLTVYANRPGTASLRAWIDMDGDRQWDAAEPTDVATKQWTAVGPYIVASNHSVMPLDWIAVSLYDHPPSGNPHRLLWCRTSITGGLSSAVLMTGINVDNSTWDREDLPIQIPLESAGYYRLESHTGTGTCGNTSTLVAYSADLYVRPVRPDLTVAAINLPQRIPVQNLFTVTAVISNITPGLTGEIFDVDFYVTTLAQPVPASGQMGLVKQWVAGIGPYGTTVITALLWLPADGQYRISVQADTTNYIEEDNEENNLTSVTVNAQCVYTTGWLNPSADMPTSGGDNNGFERNPTYAYTDGGGSAASINNGTGNNADRHIFYNYGINIPTDAITYGIEVRLDWQLDSTSGTNYMDVDLSWNGGSSWTSTKRDSNETTSEHTTVLGGPADAWGRAWSASDFSNSNFRVRVHAYSSDSARDFYLDWIPVRVTYGVCRPPELPPWDPGDIKPPGLEECTELLQVGGFEGNPQRVFTYWHAGDVGAYQQTGYLQHTGAFAMRLHASLGSYPTCAAFNPYLYQTVQIPTEVYTLTHLVVRGWRAVAGSLTDCSYRGIPDADDVLYIQLRDNAGNPIASAIPIVNGGVVTETWETFSTDFTSQIDLTALAGQNVRVHFYAAHDGDYYGTFFYLDDLSCSVCTYWPIPDPVPGTASIGGSVRTLVGGAPQYLTGVDVWAYSQGGEVLRTRTIQDGTYHFYNIPPGTYTVYSAAWVSGQLRWDSTIVTVVADERNYNVDLLLK